MSDIVVNHLMKRYGSRTAVHDVSFSVEPGEIFGILGPNGAGKTTTVEVIAGLRDADGGDVEVLGLPPTAPELRHQVGVQLQESSLPDKLRVAEALGLYASFHRHPADPAELIDRLGLGDRRDTAYAALSGGQKQRLSIALALVGNPRLVLLDELTTGLDPAARRDTWQLVRDVRDRGVTVVLVTHAMEEAQELCDRVAVIAAGRVRAVDTPAGLAGAVAGEQRLRFALTAPLPDALFTALPEVTSVRQHGPQTEVTGAGNLLFAVVGLLSRHGAVPTDLRLDQPSLDDAYLALTAADDTLHGSLR
ncbi:ABC transporter ATP-binding protein [Spirilliplanes yamanashiensis]|uniref:Multidrug ABC transporter ATP-binding protein n=1 Tax=Spirilliplanes yamanashiensis TaxID=42233 RepID=A0A8J4DHL8_9ACTN|nr:ABC transporter ATP-binding protein [Spirilliplanes yamanashiensis]MDP9819757.1 ABC-2 type transport system ATP-binding protein [Spirilliplanes yamanashiensis]GIJ01423.1 multidrug ABC transporter ATP-binding protein [Spirilliplanes yamanashiensis]